MSAIECCWLLPTAALRVRWLYLWVFCLFFQRNKLKLSGGQSSNCEKSGDAVFAHLHCRQTDGELVVSDDRVSVSVCGKGDVDGLFCTLLQPLYCRRLQWSRRVTLFGVYRLQQFFVSLLSLCQCECEYCIVWICCCFWCQQVLLKEVRSVWRRESNQVDKCLNGTGT